MPQIPNEPPVLGHSIPDTRCTSFCTVWIQKRRAKGNRPWELIFHHLPGSVNLHENTAGCSFKGPLTWSLRFKNSVPNLFLDSVNFSFLNFFLRCFWTHARHFPQVRHLGACYLAPSMHRIPGGQEMVRTKTKWPSYDLKIWRLERKPNLPQDLFFSLQILRFQIVVMSLSAGPIKCRTAFNFASTCLMNPGAKLWQVCRDSWFCCASLCVFMYFLHIWPTLSWFVRFPHRFWHSLNKISSDAEMPALSTISAASWGPFSAEKGVL